MGRLDGNPNISGEMGMLQKIREYETNGLTYAETVELFRYLISTGKVWAMNANYQATAVGLMMEDAFNKMNKAIREVIVQPGQTKNKDVFTAKAINDAFEKHKRRSIRDIKNTYQGRLDHDIF